MDVNLNNPQQWLFPTLLHSYSWNEEVKRGQVQLCNQEHFWQCATLTNPTDHLWCLDDVTGYARVILGVNQANEPIYVMVDFKSDASLKSLYLAHPDFCPIEGIVDQARALVQCIHHEQLRELVEDALSLPAVNRYFWTCPASIRDHHCYAGGLAQHTVEVATMIACSDLDIPDKDIGLAFALLHDIGKVQSYEQGELTKAASEIGHEGVGYTILAPLLEKFEQHDPSNGKTMIELLNGTWKRSTNERRPLAIGRVVNAFDQLSCERNLQRRQQWQPIDITQDKW